jgi:hypothetical protein
MRCRAQLSWRFPRRGHPPCGSAAPTAIGETIDTSSSRNALYFPVDQQRVAEQPDNAEPSSSRRALKFLGVLGTALLVAMATAIGTGLGSDVLDLFGDNDDEGDPISYSASEQINGCGTHLFFPEEQARGLVSGATPTPSPIPDWEAFRSANGGLVADESVVQVSIQGESSRTVTLTGIDFTVDAQPRPPGSTFLQPCGDAIYGRYVVADLDREPIVVSGTAEDPEAVLDPVDPVNDAQHVQADHLPVDRVGNGSPATPDRRINRALLLHLARGDSVEQRRADRSDTDRQRRRRVYRCRQRGHQGIPKRRDRQERLGRVSGSKRLSRRPSRLNRRPRCLDRCRAPSGCRRVGDGEVARAVVLDGLGDLVARGLGAHVGGVGVRDDDVDDAGTRPGRALPLLRAEAGVSSSFSDTPEPRPSRSSGEASPYTHSSAEAQLAHSPARRAREPSWEGCRPALTGSRLARRVEDGRSAGGFQHSLRSSRPARSSWRRTC